MKQKKNSQLSSDKVIKNNTELPKLEKLALKKITQIQVRFKLDSSGRGGGYFFSEESDHSDTS